MESLRNFLKSWPGRIFLLLCLSPLALLGIESYFHGGNDPNEVAKVGEESIGLNEYQSAINQRRSELLDSGKIDASQIDEAVLADEVLQSLINRALILQQVKNLGLTVSDDTITRLLRESPQFQDAEGNFSNDYFARYLQQERMTKDQLFAQIRQQLSLVQLNATISGTAIYPMNEISRLLDLQEESRPMWLYRFNWQDYIDQVNLNADDINAYYHEHKNELKSEAMVDLAYLVVSPDSITVEPVTEAEIQQQYTAFKQRNNASDNRQISQILLTGADAQTQANALKQRLDKGESFSKLAKEYSDDPSTASQGGAMGKFTPEIFGDDATTVEQALEGLAVGEASAPIKTAYGYQIFVITQNDSTVPSLESMREQLTQEALNYKRVAAYADKVTLINDLVADGYGLEDIAQQENLTLQHIKNYQQTNNDSALNQPAVINAAFDQFTIEDQGVSSGIEVNNNTVWVQPSNYRPIAPLDLQAATPTIKQLLTKEMATKLAMQQAQKTATLVEQQGVDKAGVDFIDLGMVTRQSPILNQQEKIVAFSKDTTKGQLLAMAEKTDTGASVLVVDAINKQSTPQIPADEKLRVAKMIRDNQGQSQFEDYLEYLRTVTPIDINEDIVKTNDL
ncbi:SurA N-terminal domain-containing protein [Psychrobacter sp. I-STPA10]|uniref:SurA N-terminal domain-containing protein n=1 Tax=Psychrobacter sp. I-STPA10 TaxID=2585769 RepID=UPI001E3D1E16|nr:SurA N-terminal domain-containing protein [Psychrobacter sp. I-STPA10]